MSAKYFSVLLKIDRPKRKITIEETVEINKSWRLIALEPPMTDRTDSITPVIGFRAIISLLVGLMILVP